MYKTLNRLISGNFYTCGSQKCRFLIHSHIASPLQKNTCIHAVHFPEYSFYLYVTYSLLSSYPISAGVYRLRTDSTWMTKKIYKLLEQYHLFPNFTPDTWQEATKLNEYRELICPLSMLLIVQLIISPHSGYLVTVRGRKSLSPDCCEVPWGLLYMWFVWCFCVNILIPA